MFEKFSDEVRKVMSLARQEAQRDNSEFIGSQHLLLGLAQVASGRAASVLKDLGVTLERIRPEIEKLAFPEAPMTTLGQLPFSPSAKSVIDLALKASEGLGSDLVETEHLLLGMVSKQASVETPAPVLAGRAFGPTADPRGIGTMVLEQLGYKPEAVRARTLQAIAKALELGG
jgi:ATP-dependent Clp protease ATP-binding subunit ClpC